MNSGTRSQPSGDGSLKPSRCDALVFFGATGDLAYKQIFPAPAALTKRGDLSVPIVGVARAGSLEQLQQRGRESLEAHGTYDRTTFGRFVSLLIHPHLVHATGVEQALSSIEDDPLALCARETDPTRR